MIISKVIFKSSIGPEDINSEVFKLSRTSTEKSKGLTDTHIILASRNFKFYFVLLSHFLPN